MSPLEGKHIVIVPAWWPSPEQPHAGIFFHDYIDAFANAGVRVGVVYPDLVGLRQLGRGVRKPIVPRVVHETTVGGAPVIRVRGLQSSFGSVVRRATRFRDWLVKGLAVYRERHGDPDLLHAMCAVPAGWACTHIEEPLARRVVLTEHTGPFSLVMAPAESAEVARAAFVAAAVRVAVSDHLRAQIVAAGISEPIEVHGNPVSPIFSPADTPPSGERVRGLYVGRLTEEKGISMLVGAMESILDEIRACEFHIVGEGPLAVTLAPFLHDDARRVVHHEACPRSKVADHMRAADFLVHPSLGETFGMTVAEALCTGLPVVTTSGTACAEFIDDDNGILVEPGNERALADGVRIMIDRCRAYDRKAIAARARDRFSGAAIAAAYGDVFARVMAAE